MSLDHLVANPGRLRILTALAAEPRMDFVPLRSRTKLTDGNLTTHARRLQSAGLIAIIKRVRDGKPVTSLELTLAGREALESHARALLAALDGRASAAEPHDDARPAARHPVSVTADDGADDWVD